MRIWVGSAWLNDGSRSVGSADAKTRLLAFPSTGWFSVASFGAPWQSLTRFGWLSCSGWPRKAGSAWLSVVLQLGPRLPGPRALATGPAPPGLGPGPRALGPGPRAGAPGPGPRAPKFGPAVASWFSMETAGSAWLRLAQPGSAGMGCAFHFRQGLGSSQLAMLGAIWFSLAQLGSASPCGHRGAGQARPPAPAPRPSPAQHESDPPGPRASSPARLRLSRASLAPVGRSLAQLGSAWLSAAARIGGRAGASAPHIRRSGSTWFSMA